MSPSVVSHKAASVTVFTFTELKFSKSKVSSVFDFPVSFGPRNNKNGKAGAWQLSYIIGRKFGLTIKDYLDERKDVNRSTQAAAKYLKTLEHYFNGNSLLVITAFYTAVPYVKKRVEKNQPFNPELFFERGGPFGDEGWQVEGHATFPKGDGPFPAVVLVHRHGASPGDGSRALSRRQEDPGPHRGPLDPLPGGQRAGVCARGRRRAP